MFCGTGSFKNVDDCPWSAPSATSPTKRKASKNPYSARGLDKYSTVLAELEARRAKVMENVGSQGGAMVRFVYNSNEWIPIIIKLRDAEDAPQLQHEAKKKPKASPPSPRVLQSDKPRKESSRPPAPLHLDGSDADHRKEGDGTEGIAEAAPAVLLRKRLEKTFSWGVRDQATKGWSWRSLRPRYYWPLVAVLVLACLVAFGRAFAICCTSIWWYLVPVMQQQGETTRTVRRSMRTKMDHGRRTFNKPPQQQQPQGAAAEQPRRSASSPEKARVGPQEVTSPRGHANAKRR